MKTKMIVLAGCLIVLLAGCEEQPTLMQEKIQLQKENQKLVNQIEKMQTEKEQLSEQIKVLSELSPEIRLKNVANIGRIELHRRTGLYDKDKDGSVESLVVYLRTLDDTGDAIKAAGLVKLQLWDLDRPAKKSLLGQWDIPPEELKKYWSGTLMTSYYRFTFDVGKLLKGREQQLTVKIKFIDYLTGKVLNDQKAIKL